MELYEYTTASFNEFVDHVFAKGQSEKGMLKNLLKMALDLEESEKFIHFYLDDYPRIKAHEQDPIKHTAVVYRDALYQIVIDKFKDEEALEPVEKDGKAEEKENSEQNQTREESGESDLEELEKDEKEEKVLEKSSEEEKEAHARENQRGEGNVKAENMLYGSDDHLEKLNVKERDSQTDEQNTKSEIEQQKSEPENKIQDEIHLKQPEELNVTENKKTDEINKEKLTDKEEGRHIDNAQAVEKATKEQFNNEKISKDDEEAKGQDVNFEVDSAHGDEAIPSAVKKTEIKKPETPKLEKIILKKDSQKSEKGKILKGKEVEGLDLDKDFFEPEITQSGRLSSVNKKKGSYESNRETPKVLKPISKDFNHQELQKAINIEADKVQEDEPLDLDQDFVELDNIPEKQTVLVVETKTADVPSVKQEAQETYEVKKSIIVVAEGEDQDLKDIEQDEIMASREELEEEIPLVTQNVEVESAEHNINVNAEVEYRIVRVSHQELLKSITEEDSKEIETTYKSITKSEAERNNLSVDKILPSPENHSTQGKVGSQILLDPDSGDVSRKQSFDTEQPKKVDRGSADERVPTDQEDKNLKKSPILTPSPVETQEQQLQTPAVLTPSTPKEKKEVEIHNTQPEKQVDNFAEVSFRASSSREYKFEEVDPTEKKEDVVLDKDEVVSKPESQKVSPEANSTVEQDSDRKQSPKNHVPQLTSQESETQRMTPKSSDKEIERSTPKSVDLIKTERDTKQANVSSAKKIETPTSSDKSSTQRKETEKEHTIIDKKVTSPSNTDKPSGRYKEQVEDNDEPEKSIPRSKDAVKTEGDASSGTTSEKKVSTPSSSGKKTPKHQEAEKDQYSVKNETDRSTPKTMGTVRTGKLENTVVDNQVATPKSENKSVSRQNENEKDYIKVKNETNRSIPKSIDIIKTETDLKLGNFTSDRNVPTPPGSTNKINIRQRETEYSQIQTETERINMVKQTSTDRGNKIQDEEIVTFSVEEGESSRQVPSSLRKEEPKDLESHVSEHVAADDEPIVAQRVVINTNTAEQSFRAQKTPENKPKIVIKEETPKQNNTNTELDIKEKKPSLDKSFEPKPYHRRLDSMVDKKPLVEDRKNTPKRSEPTEKKVQEPAKRPSISRGRITVAPERAQTSSPEIRPAPVPQTKHFGYGPAQVQHKNSLGGGAVAAKEVTKLNPISRNTFSTENNQSWRGVVAVKKGAKTDGSHETQKVMETSGLGEGEQKLIKTNIVNNNKKFLIDQDLMDKSASQRNNKEDSSRYYKRDTTHLKPREERGNSLEPIRKNNLSQDMSATMGQQHLWVRPRNIQEASVITKLKDQNHGESDYMNMSQAHSSQYSHNRQASTSYVKKPDFEELLDPFATGEKLNKGGLPEDVGLKIRKAMAKQKQGAKKNDLYNPYNIEWTKKVLKNHFDVELEPVDNSRNGVKKWKVRRVRHGPDYSRNQSPVNVANITQDYLDRYRYMRLSEINLDSAWRKQEEQDQYVNKNRLLKQRHSQPDQRDLGLEAILHSKDKININNYIQKPSNPPRGSSPVLEPAPKGDEYMHLMNASRPQTMHDGRAGGINRTNKLLSKASGLKNREIEIMQDTTFGEISEVKWE